MKRARRHTPARALALTALCGLLDACANQAPNGGGSSPPGTGGTGGAANTTNVEIKPDASGWVDPMSNDIGIQGAFYPYGDRYGVAKCLNVGMHAPDECSLITSPLPPPATGFPNQAGSMCTTGATAVILPCKPGVTTSGCPTDDYSNMWGAGMGFDFNAVADMDAGTTVKSTWNPDDHGVIGVAFEIDTVPAPGLRVEFPLRLTDSEAQAVNLPPGSTTDDHPDGAPYWGGDTSFSNSPVSAGHNELRWDAVKKPGTTPSYVFDKSRLLGVQFHVPAVKVAPPGAYSFCVSHLTLLRQ